MPPFEFIDHPADTGLKITGSTPEEIFIQAALGLDTLLTGDFQAFRAGGSSPVRTSISLSADSRESLFFEWLRELIFLFSARREVYFDFHFDRLEEERLVVRAEGKLFDPAAGQAGVEVKAVTFHQFYFRQAPSGLWEAQVIFDI